MTEKNKVVSVRMPDKLHTEIKDAAVTDYRSVSDELNYLLTLGLESRERVMEAHEAVQSGRTQISPEMLRRP